jgi:hypothetical protein
VVPEALDYQVFIHILDDSSGPIAQADFQPKAGAYPTSVWSPGETIEECIGLDTPDLPPSDWRFAIGLYDLATGQRLPVSDANGQLLSNDMVLVQP